MSVFVIIRYKNVTTGHGESDDFPILEQKGNGYLFEGWLPAFPTRAAAKSFLLEFESKKYSGLEIVELQVQ